MADAPSHPAPPSRRPRALVNGFGRIGRLALRRALGAGGAPPPPFDVVAVNEPSAIESSAYLLQFDSVQGRFGEAAVAADGASFTVEPPGGGPPVELAYSTHTDLSKIPLRELGMDIVLECSGKFLTRAALQPLLDGGARAVVVSAPVDDAARPVLNVVYGVNHGAHDPADPVVTAASCTTNCLAPVVKVILENFGIERGALTTIHDVTNTQTVVDAANAKKSDLRRARSALVNLAPTSTGSAKAIALVFPQLKGKLNGVAVRVPLLNGSITDCVFQVSRPTTVAEVNAAFEAAAADGPLAGVLGYETRPLVSSDYTGDSRSGVVDAACTQVIDGTMVKVLVWYDNEWGYSCRFVDVASMVARTLA